MRVPLISLVLIFSFTSCKEKAEPKAEPINIEIDKKVIPLEKVDLSRVPDSLELVENKALMGDFNGDDKMDFASVVKNTKNGKTGVLILHNAINKELFIFGAGIEVNQMTDLSWIEIFNTIPKGEVVSPTLVDEESGDILRQDESQKFKLIGNGINMYVKESHGGGILFWNGKEYQWYHIG